MSDLWLNLRIGCWHLQIGRSRPWVALRFNEYRAECRAFRPFIQFH